MKEKNRGSNPEAKKFEPIIPDDIEILELDERLDLAPDPYSLFDDNCCRNKSCNC